MSKKEEQHDTYENNPIEQIPTVGESKGPPCYNCGSRLLTKAGTCYVCMNCGSTTGCS